MGVHDPEKVKAAMPSTHVAPRFLSAIGLFVWICSSALGESVGEDVITIDVLFLLGV